MSSSQPAACVHKGLAEFVAELTAVVQKLCSETQRWRDDNENKILVFEGVRTFRADRNIFGVVSPHLPVGKKILRFCLV